MYTTQLILIMKKLGHLLFEVLTERGISDQAATYINMFVLATALLLVIFLIDFITRKILVALFTKLASRSKTSFDDILITNKAPRNIAHLIPYLIALEFTPYVLNDFTYAAGLANKALHIFGIILILWIARSVFSTLKDFFKTIPGLKDKPIDSYIQVFMMFAWGIGLISIFGVLLNVSFSSFFTTIGAASAIIILVFRDTILGFVASIQVSINDMVRIGDWITFNKYGADGDVIEINLSTVKVQNFDKTITTIPTYALISDSFKNWRGMESSEGRRIKRAMLIKIASVKYLDAEAIEKLSKIELISNYITNRQDKINQHNTTHSIDKSLALNGRNLTNIGVFRKYTELYLNNHSAINKDMMVMVRQLAPTAQGMPLEIYAFSSDKRWDNYEYIIADIFDHLIAASAYFDLELFEYHTNSNL